VVLAEPADPDVVAALLLVVEPEVPPEPALVVVVEPLLVFEPVVDEPFPVSLHPPITPKTGIEKPRSFARNRVWVMSDPFGQREQACSSGPVRGIDGKGSRLVRRRPGQWFPPRRNLAVEMEDARGARRTIDALFVHP
jgi:hypothetical protein